MLNIPRSLKANNSCHVEKSAGSIFKWVSLITSHTSVLIYVIMHFESLLIATLRSLTCIIKNNFVLLSWLIAPLLKSNLAHIGESTSTFSSKLRLFQTKNLCWLRAGDIGRRPLQSLPILSFSRSLQWHLVITKSALLLALSLSTFYLLILLPRCQLESVLVIEGSNLPVEVFLIHLVNCIVLIGRGSSYEEENMTGL